MCDAAYQHRLFYEGSNVVGELRTYILSVIASSVICGCAQMLVGPKGSSATLVRMLCGIYMAFVLIAPIQRIDFSVYSDYFSGFMNEANQTVALGENMAKEKQEEIIKKQIESYILEKAVSLGAEITVEVTLSRDTLPTP